MKQPLSLIAIRHRQGFTLVEVMVAMVIGMIGMIIMLQVFAVAEAQKRATTGGGDAQTNGAMAVYSLQRDLRQAGYGFNGPNALGCTLALPAPASRTLARLAPVVINPPTTDVPAGDANTDTLLIAYGAGEGTPEGEVITAVNGDLLAVPTPANYLANQLVIAAPPAPIPGCGLTLATVTAAAVPPSPNVTVPGSGAGDGGTLFNLGAAPRIIAYAVRGGNLTSCEYLQADCSNVANYVPVINNIASLRAQYGRDAGSPNPARVITWDQTTPSPANPGTLGTAATFACQWARISALRIAVVARNSQVDKDTLTAVAPTWEGSATQAIDLSARANWQNYRYRVFETVIPLRNLSWMATCQL